MKPYEGVFIFPPESLPEVRKNQIKNLDDLFAKYKAEVIQRTEWGKKMLGYPLKKFHEGFFLVIDFRMDPAHANEFRKGLELQEELLKYMITVKNTQAEKAPQKTTSPTTTPTTPVAPSSSYKPSRAPQAAPTPTAS